MSSRPKTIIVDTNILIRAVLGVRTLSILQNNQTEIYFCTPKTCFQEVKRHIPAVLKKQNFTDVEKQNNVDSIQLLENIVHSVDESILLSFKQDALSRIKDHDADDWSLVALALALNCPIWTEDRDFFGTGIATWRTKNIHLFLES